jgi:hypothetical protein
MQHVIVSQAGGVDYATNLSSRAQSGVGSMCLLLLILQMHVLRTPGEVFGSVMQMCCILCSLLLWTLTAVVLACCCHVLTLGGEAGQHRGAAA